MPIDNFSLVRDKILCFDNKGDFFFVLILKRRKDTKGSMVEGVNEDNRLIKHYFIYDIEYLDRKADAIRRLCDDNDARAYILPQRRNSKTVLWNLHKKTSELLETNDQGVHFDHLIRSCVAGCHKSDRPRWVIDIDRDAPELNGYTDEQFNEYVYDVINLITEIRMAYNQPLPHDSIVVPTPHGVHIVTEPFNKQEFVAQRKVRNNLPFWDNNRVQADGMTLLYSNLK